MNNTHRKHRWGLLILVLILLIIAAAVFVLVKIGFIHIEPTNSSSEQPETVMEKVEDAVEDVWDADDGSTEIDPIAQLEEVVKTSTLYVAEYPYNGVAVAYTEPDKNGETEVRYYVAYEGSVKASIDVTQIQVIRNDENHTITIQLPEVKMETPTVDAGTLDFIFTKDSYNTETVAQEANRLALEDLNANLADDDSIIEAATEMAKASELALVEPWVDQLTNNEYTVQVLAYGEEVSE